MNRILIAVGLVMVLAAAQCAGATGPPQTVPRPNPK